jgi:hypothetical protein
MALPLENTYLQICRTFLPVQLHQGGEDEQRQAAGILQSVVYRDEEVRAALVSLE